MAFMLKSSMPMRTREEQREYQRLWIAKRRQDWIDSQGGVCAQCGSQDGLEVDHIDPTTKTRHPRDIWSRNAVEREIELAKCQVLCAACHQAKTSAWQRANVKPLEELKHGIGTYSDRGCRCEICKAAKRVKNARYRDKQKNNTPH